MLASSNYSLEKQRRPNKMELLSMLNTCIDIPAATWGSIIFLFIVFGVGFTLGSFGGMFSECSGIINISLDGSMLIGAFSGILFIQQIYGWMGESALLNNWFFVNFIYILGMLMSVVVGIAFSFLLSFISIKFKADQTIVGTAMNSLAAAIVLILNTIHLAKDEPNMNTSMSFNVMNYNTESAFFNGAFSNINITVLIGIILIFALIFLINKTRFGLRLRACGENPAAADSVGINVNKMRYISTAIGSASASIGGFIIFSCLRLGEWNLASGVFGYGFLVLAIEILGNWKAINITLASLFFAAFFALSNFMVTAFSGSWNNPINSKAFYNMLPYLLAFLSLIIFSKKSHAPKAEGIPYDKSSR